VPTPTSKITDLGLLGGFIAGPGGGTVTWQVMNLGPVDANGVVLIEHLPLGITVQSTATSPVGFCSQSPAFDGSIRLACGLSTLPHGQAWTVTVAVSMSAINPVTAARVTFTGTDSNTANNHSLITMNNSTGNGVTSVSSNTTVNLGFDLVLQSLPDDPVGAQPAADQKPADQPPVDAAPVEPRAVAAPKTTEAMTAEPKTAELKAVDPAPPAEAVSPN
jgi:uncharacterized repeat protein (TIGR01451 family)